ncbi:MAG: hypothetical protein A3J74_02320 [Elusimicrobia bacterium RIFCSPHIGHO2_02_FULL_57_9]|nr:MAG: hypothetical protein A3J74_02320 [Elusimicrobia bacterium RIFCSPHIGHO2_02_FULL_57_9]
MVLLKRFAALLLPLFFGSCVATYRDFPREHAGQGSRSKPHGTLHYQIAKWPIISLGGEGALYDFFQGKTGFQKTVRAVEAPSQGLYCLVDVQWRPLTGSAAVWSYISAITMTFIPAYSGREGYFVNYHLFIDGQKKQTYTYEITRKAGLWLGLLPFAWINFLTYSEAEAFEATAFKFLAQAELFFPKAPSP